MLRATTSLTFSEILPLKNRVLTMFEVSQCHEPGLLMVLTKPRLPEHLKEFHSWYNTEHGPARMKLNTIQNGYRYKSTGPQPVWVGMYDLTRVSAVTEPQYTKLRDQRSRREKEVMSSMVHILERKIYRRISSRGCNIGPAPVILRVSFVVKNTASDEVHRWYEQEHLEDLSRIPGWLRSRRYELVGGDEAPPGCVELLAVHEFDQDNGLGGPEHVFARSRPWRNKIINMIESRDNTRFSFYHEFRAEDYEQPAENALASTSTTLPTCLDGDGLSRLHAGVCANDHASPIIPCLAPPAVF